MNWLKHLDMCCARLINKTINQSNRRWVHRCWISHLGALGALRPSRSWCCPGCQQDNGTWLSRVAGHGWPEGSRTAASPGGSQVQRSMADPHGSFASGWRASVHPRPRSGVWRCRRGTTRRTRWGRLSSVDLEGDEKGTGLWKWWREYW